MPSFNQLNIIHRFCRYVWSGQEMLTICEKKREVYLCKDTTETYSKPPKRRRHITQTNHEKLYVVVYGVIEKGGGRWNWRAARGTIQPGSYTSNSSIVNIWAIDPLASGCLVSLCWQMLASASFTGYFFEGGAEAWEKRLDGKNGSTMLPCRHWFRVPTGNLNAFGRAF